MDNMGSFVLGLYYGYPMCCADGFIKDFDARTYAGVSFPLDGTGFVPCPRCASTKTAEQLTAEINSMRVCPAPFPQPPGEYIVPEIIDAAFAKEMMAIRIERMEEGAAYG